jgi:hypothetical protein
MKAPKCKLCKERHYNYQPHVLGGVSQKVVRATKPSNVKRPVVTESVVPLSGSVSTDLAGEAGDLAPTDVGIEVATGTSLSEGLSSEGVSLSPVPHVGGVTSETVTPGAVTGPVTVGASEFIHTPLYHEDSEFVSENTDVPHETYDWDKRERELGLS